MTEQKLHQEEKSLVMAIRDTFLPRLHGRDASVFATLITDLWPYLNIPMVFGGELDILSKPPPSRTSHKDGSGRIRTARSITSSKSLKGMIQFVLTCVITCLFAWKGRYSNISENKNKMNQSLNI